MRRKLGFLLASNYISHNIYIIYVLYFWALVNKSRFAWGKYHEWGMTEKTKRTPIMCKSLKFQRLGIGGLRQANGKFRSCLICRLSWATWWDFVSKKRTEDTVQVEHRTSVFEALDSGLSFAKIKEWKWNLDLVQLLENSSYMGGNYIVKHYSCFKAHYFFLNLSTGRFNSVTATCWLSIINMFMVSSSRHCFAD